MHCLMLACVLLAAVTSPVQLPGAAPANPFGDPTRASTPHLTVESSISHPTAAPGTRLTVTLAVTPRPTMHVYAPGKHDYQVVQLVLDPQPWAKLESTKYPASEKYHFEPLNETVEVYSKAFRLTREMIVLDTPDARQLLAGQKSLTVSGRLEYQACDDKVCYSPSKVPVSFVVTIK
jgi:cytochrome c biogenesis DsbD-like protein